MLLDTEIDRSEIALPAEHTAESDGENITEFVFPPPIHPRTLMEERIVTRLSVSLRFLLALHYL